MRKPVKIIVIVCGAFLFVGPSLGAPVTEETLRSVVTVLPEWPGGETRKEEPEGTGVVLYKGGYIVTMDHVLGAATKVRVGISDGRTVAAEIVGRDKESDLALLKADAGLPPIARGEVPGMGAPVCAIGNQFGLGLSVTCGVVSATGRNGLGFARLEDHIQTDTTVNPGSSGGALIDSNGRLVGILAAIFTKGRDGDLGVNFAAQLPFVLRITDDLRNHGKVQRGYAGLQVRNLTKAERATETGVRVAKVDPDGPASAAGVLVDDLLVAIDGKPVRKAVGAFVAIHMRRAGEAVALTVRREGKTREIKVTLAK